MPRLNKTGELTQREREVLVLVSQGMSNQQIADQTITSVNTARLHVNNILGKLGVHNRTEACVVYWRTELERTQTELQAAQTRLDAVSKEMAALVFYANRVADVANGKQVGA